MLKSPKYKVDLCLPHVSLFEPNKNLSLRIIWGGPFLNKISYFLIFYGINCHFLLYYFCP